MKLASPHLTSALLYSDARPGNNIVISTIKPHATSEVRMDAQRILDDQRRADIHGLEQEIRATRIFIEISAASRGEASADAVRKLAELENSYRALTEHFRTQSTPQNDRSPIPQPKHKIGRFSNDDT